VQSARPGAHVHDGDHLQFCLSRTSFVPSRISLPSPSLRLSLILSASQAGDPDPEHRRALHIPHIYSHSRRITRIFITTSRLARLPTVQDRRQTLRTASPTHVNSSHHLARRWDTHSPLRSVPRPALARIRSRCVTHRQVPRPARGTTARMWSVWVARMPCSRCARSWQAAMCDLATLSIATPHRPPLSRRLTRVAPPSSCQSTVTSLGFLRPRAYCYCHDTR